MSQLHPKAGLPGHDRCSKAPLLAASGRIA